MDALVGRADPAAARLRLLADVWAVHQDVGGSRPAGVLTVPWYDWRHDYAAVLPGVGVPPERIQVFDLPAPGAADSGLLVADLRSRPVG